MIRLPSDYKDVELSHATMLNEDLIPAFMKFLQEVKGICEAGEEVDALQAEVDTLNDDWDSEAADFICNEDLFNILNELAPECCYFGSHEGDGSCYGFWFAAEPLELIEGGIDHD